MDTTILVLLKAFLYYVRFMYLIFYMYVCAPCACLRLQKVSEGVGSSGSRVMDDCEP